MPESSSWKDGILLKVVNVLVYFLFLGSSIRTATTGWYYNSPETYISPATWSFFIWYLIHALLFGTIIYQFFPGGKHTIIDGVSWRFPLLAALTSVYVSLTSSEHYKWAFVFSLFVSSAVTHIYYIVKKHHSAQSVNDEIWVHLPFSLWHGWTTVLVVVSAFSAFGVRQPNPAGVWTKVFVFLALFFLEGTAATYAFSTPEGDLPASIAIAFSLWAIYANQHQGFIRISALVFAVLALIWVARGVYGLAVRFRSGRISIGDEERGPLVGGH